MEVKHKRGNTTLSTERGVLGIADIAFDALEEAQEERREKWLLWDVIERLANEGHKKEDVFIRVLQAAKHNANRDTLLRIIKTGEDDEEYK
jgi:hypothetical protein